MFAASVDRQLQSVTLLAAPRDIRPAIVHEKDGWYERYPVRSD